LLNRDKEKESAAPKLASAPHIPLTGVTNNLLERPPQELQWRNAGGTGHYR
jgi:hypothetical protein